MSEAPGLRYADTGVDLDAAERAKQGIKDLVSSTRDENTLSEMGSFGGLYRLPAGIADPVLVSSADGVGTKLKVAFLADRHGTVGEDLVNHCVNDILVQGAVPMFFLDYLATGVLEERVVHDVVAGVARGCSRNGCALLGGETAQMPDFYAEGEYDLAGFVVGVVARGNLIDGSRVRPGDPLVAIGSSGLHTNGYTLARRIVFGALGLDVGSEFPGMSGSVADVLLEVHRSYLPALAAHLGGDAIEALAHVTGGGIPGNLPRALPDGLGAVVDSGTWTVPPVFQVLQEAGGVETSEMFRVFNMGVGMIAVTAPAHADSLVESLRDAGERAWVCGEVVRGAGARVVGASPA